MDAIPGVSAFPSGDNLTTWDATIEGSEGTCYEGLSYEMTISFSVRPPSRHAQPAPGKKPA